MPVAISQNIEKLEYPAREKVQDNHHCKAHVQAPEGDPYVFLHTSPFGIRKYLPNSEHHKGHGEHSEDAHHRSMAMIWRQYGTHFKVADDG